MIFKRFTAAGAAILALAAGAAYAAIPDGNGVIHGCYEKGTGKLGVRTETPACRRAALRRRSRSTGG
jgi:hypothetical protein